MKYPKIPAPFKRSEDGKTLTGTWISEEVEALADTQGWVFTEKVDGTNVRVQYDGYNVSISGRTDAAQLHPDLVAVVSSQFPVEIFEEIFGERPAILFGEGYGAGIQSGGDYSKTKKFILFDSFAYNRWGTVAEVREVADAFKADAIPILGVGTLNDGIDTTAKYGWNSVLKQSLVPGTQLLAEGVVASHALGFLNKNGNRIQVKLKHVDLLGSLNWYPAMEGR